jgi:PAS domain S-box-containing protein
MVAGMLGASVTALALAGVLGYSTGLFGTLRQGVLMGMALPEAAGFLALGITVTSFAWHGGMTQATLPRWFPLAAGSATLLTVLFITRALVLEQNARLALRVATEARIARQEVALRLGWVGRSLRSLAARTTRGRPSRAAWVADAAQLAIDLDGLVTLLLVDSNGRLWAVTPPGSSPGTLGFDPGRDLPTGPGPDTARVVPYDARGRGFALVIPVCLEGRCGAHIVGLVSTAGFFGAVLRSETAEYVFSVRAGMGTGAGAGAGAGADRVFVSDSALARLASPGNTRELDPDLPGWQLTTQPSLRTLALARTSLPEVVLGLGLAVSVLLSLTLRLAQTAWARARREERDRLHRALSTATDGLWEWDLAMDEAVRSEVLWQRLGYGPADTEPRPSRWVDLIHPDDRTRYDTALAAYLEGRAESFELEYRVQARSGEWHWIVDRGRAAERNERGAPRRLMGISGDVTERKRAELGLAASERRFRSIFNSAFQFQGLLDLDGELLEINRGALEFGGVELEAVRGRPLWELPWWGGSPEAVQRVKDSCLRAARGEVVRYQEEVNGVDGHLVALDFSLKPILDERDLPTQLLVEARDITALQRAENALREVEALATMGRLAARVAHEINNPLAGIQNAFLLIKDAVPPTHPHYAYVGAIEREITRIAGVTRQLYETYRHGQEAQRECAMARVISDAVTLLSQANRDAGVTIQGDAGGVPAIVPVPDAMLRQTIFNLVQNAVDASPAGGTVWVRAWSENGTLQLSVRDQGAGVPPGLRERVFEPFFSTKSGMRAGGMGLGLTLVRRSVLALGGRIWIAEGVEPGAEFRVELPIGRKEG